MSASAARTDALAGPGVDELAAGIARRRTQRAAASRTFGIVLTRRCSVGCAHCINDSRPGNPDALSIETVRAAVSQLRDHDGYTTVNLTGGEPFEVYDLLLQSVELVTA